MSCGLALALASFGACSEDGGAQCPAGPPEQDQACLLLGQRCEYAGSPCGVTAQCAGGSWDLQSECPPAQQCPEQLPLDGEPCTLDNPIAGSLSCSYGLCPEGTLGGPEQRAECNGQQWSVTAIECREAIACGECPPGRNCEIGCDPATSELPCTSNHCELGNLCLYTPLNASEWLWDCAINQCGADPVDCSCIGSVCGQRGFPGDWVCVETQAHVVTCACEGPECA